MNPGILDRLIRSLGKSRPPVRPKSGAQRAANRVFNGLFLACLGAFIVWRVHLGFAIQHQIAAIRAAGLPSSPPELDRWYQAVPDDRNAAIVLTNAFGLLKTFPDERAKRIKAPGILDRREPWNEEFRQNVIAYVAMNQEATDKAQEALRRSECRYPVDLSYGLQSKLPHLDALKSLGRLAALRAILAAEDGRKENCAADIEFILRLARTLDDEPQLISQYVRGSLVAMAEKKLWNVASTDARSEVSPMTRSNSSSSSHRPTPYNER